jgi:hypothetical protein
VAIAEERVGVEDPGDPAPVGGVGGDPGDVDGGDSVPPVWRGDRGETAADAVVASDGSESISWSGAGADESTLGSALVAVFSGVS